MSLLTCLSPQEGHRKNTRSGTEQHHFSGSVLHRHTSAEWMLASTGASTKVLKGNRSAHTTPLFHGPMGHLRLPQHSDT